ncbi:MAG: hypothetical protein ACREQ2_05525 [Candidatus Binatia bacterium]
MKADGSGLEVFARGVRNSAGFDWHPSLKNLPHKLPKKDDEYPTQYRHEEITNQP